MVLHICNTLAIASEKKNINDLSVEKLADTYKRIGPIL